MQVWSASVEVGCSYLSINQTSRCSHITGYSCNPRHEQFHNGILGLHFLPEPTCLNTGPGDFVSREPLCWEGTNQPHTAAHRDWIRRSTSTTVLAHSPDWISAHHAFILRTALKWISHWFLYSTSTQSALFLRDNTLKSMATGECGYYTILQLSLKVHVSSLLLEICWKGNFLNRTFMELPCSRK